MKQSKIKKLANLCTTTKVAQRNRLYSIFGACATLNCVGGGGLGENSPTAEPSVSMRLLLKMSSSIHHLFPPEDIPG